MIESSNIANRRTGVVMSEKLHHPYSPSKLEFLEVCPHYESVNSASEKARLGTLQHTAAETGQDDSSLSDEEAAAVAECIDFFEKKKQAWEVDGSITELSEIYFPIDTEIVEGFQGTTGGYLDRALIDHTGTKAILFDWKYGQWKVTEASENLQAAAYTLGLFKAYPKIQDIEFFFKQPHIKSISSARWTRADVPALYLRILTVVSRARRARASGSFNFTNPTIPCCLFCSNLALCPAVAALVLRAGNKFLPVEIPSEITPTMVHDSKNSTMGMRLASLVTAWAQAFRSLTVDRVLRGAAPVPKGYKIAQGAGKRKIIDSTKFQHAALNYLTKEVYDTTVEPQLGKVEAAIKDTAPRGMKDSTVKEFKALLLDTGAVKAGEQYPYLKAVSEDDNEES